MKINNLFIKKQDILKSSTLRDNWRIIAITNVYFHSGLCDPLVQKE